MNKKFLAFLNTMESMLKKSKLFISNRKIALVISTILILPFALGHLLVLISFANKNIIDITNYLMNPIYTLVSAIIIQFVFGYRFYLEMYKEIFIRKRTGLNTLVGSSTLLCFLWSISLFFYNVIINNTIYNSDGYQYFFEVGCAIIYFVILGKVISSHLKLKSISDINSVAKLIPKNAYIYDPITKTKTEILCSNIKVNDLIFVAKNQIIPLDAIIYENHTYCDESFLSGEIEPVYKTKGSLVYGSSINLGQDIILKAKQKANQSKIALILRKIKKLQNSKPKIQKIADKFSRIFSPIVLSLALLSFLIHFFLGFQLQEVFNLNFKANFTQFNSADFNWQKNFASALYYAIALIAIACPCAIGIATPLAIIIGSGIAIKNGIIFNKHDVFEKIKKLNLFAFDKTGTLTEGKLEVVKILGKLQYLAIFLEMEKNSIHPIAKTISSYIIKNYQLDRFDLDSVEEIAGKGIKAYKNNDTYLICAANQISSNIDLNQKLLKQFSSTNKTELNQLALIKNQKVIMYIFLKDKLRIGAKNVIRQLDNQKIKSIIISGDKKENVASIANQLDISEYYFKKDPLQKAAILEKEKKLNKFVGYIGDGLNDLVALEEADFSISNSLVNEQANKIADISIINGDILNIYRAIYLSKKTRSLIIFNFIWAFSYNLIALPLAFLEFIPPIISTLFMAFSEISIILNTLWAKYRITKKFPK